MAHAVECMKRTCDSRRGWHEADLAYTLGAERALGLVLLDEMHFDLGHVARAQDAELAQLERDRPAAHTGQLLGGRVAQSHVCRPFDLSPAQGRVDRAADVVARGVAQGVESIRAGLDVGAGGGRRALPLNVQCHGYEAHAREALARDGAVG